MGVEATLNFRDRFWRPAATVSVVFLIGNGVANYFQRQDYANKQNIDEHKVKSALVGGTVDNLDDFFDVTGGAFRLLSDGFGEIGDRIDNLIPEKTWFDESEEAGFNLEQSQRMQLASNAIISFSQES